MTPPERRLAQELLATADALRTVAVEVLDLDKVNHPAVSGHPETAAVRAFGHAVADALEGLATRLYPRM